MRGIEARASRPQDEASTGTSRQPRARAGFHQFRLQYRAAMRRGRVVLRQEHVAGRDDARMQRASAFSGQRAHELVRAVEQHAATVARQAVGGHPAAMGHARERFERGIHDGARWRIPDRGDQAETATVAFTAGVVETPIRAFRHGRGRVRGGKRAPRAVAERIASSE
jgi:hypothetical protein